MMAHLKEIYQKHHAGYTFHRIMVLNSKIMT